MISPIRTALYYLGITGNGESRDSGGGRDNDNDHGRDVACPHNGRDGISTMDVIEHLGNCDFGSAARDIADRHCEYEPAAGFNQPPSSSDSPPASTSDTAKT
jgi:hypothetical protein